MSRYRLKSALPRKDKPSRRDVLKAGAVLAANSALYASAFGQNQAGRRSVNPDDAAVIELLSRRKTDPDHPILIRGGTLISMDPAIGDFEKGDLLIHGKKIVALGPKVQAPAHATVVDASNTILLPGFVDSHRHAWLGQLRRIIPNATSFGEYLGATHEFFALHYRPQDMYVGNFVTALGCIDAGITTIIDNSNNARTSEHSDAAIKALFDSGIRAVHAPGKAQAGDWAQQWPQDLARLKRTYFSTDDQLVTLGMFTRGLDRQSWAVARDLGIRICSEVDGSFTNQIDEFYKAKLLGADNNFNHAFGFSDTTWRQILGSGCTVNVCPRSDAQYGFGEGISGLQKALDNGARPGLSIDNEVSYGNDMFTEMHVAFNIQRAMSINRKFHGEVKAPAPVGVRTVLECATANGAACAGLASKCGALKPGMEADIVLIRTDDVNLYPSNNAIGTVVLAADIKNVDTVIIAGQIRKFRGNLVGVDLRKFRQLVDESRDHIFTSAGYKPDLFASQNGIR